MPILEFRKTATVPARAAACPDPGDCTIAHDLIHNMGIGRARVSVAADGSVTLQLTEHGKAQPSLEIVGLRLAAGESDRDR